MVKETTNEGNVMRRTLELKMLPEGDTEVIDGLVKYNIVVLNVGRDFLS